MTQTPLFTSLTKENWRNFGVMIVSHRPIPIEELKYHRMEAVLIFVADIQHKLTTREAQEKYGVFTVSHWHEVLCCLACYILHPDKELTSSRVTEQDLELIIGIALSK